MFTRVLSQYVMSKVETKHFIYENTQARAREPSPGQGRHAFSDAPFGCGTYQKKIRISDLPLTEGLTYNPPAN